MKTRYAKVAWTPGDVQTLRPHMTKQQAADWLNDNERHLQDATVEHGWHVIAHLLAYDPPQSATNTQPASSNAVNHP